MRHTVEYHAKYIVILAVLLGSTSGIMGKLITADAMAIGFFRLTLALPFFLFPVLHHKRHELVSLSKKDFLWSGLSGMFLFWHFLCWFTAVKNTSIASAIILADLHPLMVMAITVFILKKKIPLQAAFGVILALVGGALVVGIDFGSSGHHLFGDMMAIATAAAMGLYFSIGGVLRKRIPGDLYITLVFSACWSCFAIGMILTKTPVFGYPISDYLWLMAMTVLCQLGAHAVLNWSMRYVTALYVSAWSTAEIVTAPLLALLVLGEIPGISKIIGGIIVIGGLLYYNYHEGDILRARKNV